MLFRSHLPQAEPLSLAISSKRLIRPLLPNAHSVPPAPETVAAPTARLAASFVWISPNGQSFSTPGSLALRRGKHLSSELPRRTANRKSSIQYSFPRRIWDAFGRSPRKFCENFYCCHRFLYKHLPSPPPPAYTRKYLGFSLAEAGRVW